LIEGKSSNRLPMAILRDVKSRRSKYPSAEVLGVLLATHPDSPIPHRFGMGLVKYRRDINLRITEEYGAEGVLSKCRKVVEELFKGAGIDYSRGSIHAGDSFGASVDIEYWLIG